MLSGITRRKPRSSNSQTKQLISSGRPPPHAVPRSIGYTRCTEPGAFAHTHSTTARQRRAASARLAPFPVKNKLFLPPRPPATAPELAPGCLLRGHRSSGRGSLRSSAPSGDNAGAGGSNSHHFQALPKPNSSGQLQGQGEEENSSYRTWGTARRGVSPE